MFGTVIIDAYRKDETSEIVEAIDDLCHPDDNYGWASAGIYCFWDYYIEEILYIGLASDLCERFKQHNGILSIDEACSKQKKIEEYFSRNERLGYSIFVQSPLSQPLTHRNKSTYLKFAKQINSLIGDCISEQGKDDIKRVEGILIEAYKSRHGHFPPWNKIGGAVIGQKNVMKKNYNIINSLCKPDASMMNPIVAKSTLRELSKNAEYAGYESFLHAVRMNMLMHGMEYPDALAVVNKYDEYDCYKNILDAEYNKKKLVV